MQVDTIEWHEFVVVEKIELYDDEEMKAVEDEEILRQQVEQARYKEQVKQMMEENEQIIQNPTAVPPQVQSKTVKDETQNEKVVSNALEPEMKIKKNYQRKEEQQQNVASGTQKCPKCQQEIPRTEWKEHMRLELMDPRWREEKEQREKRAQLNSLA